MSVSPQPSGDCRCPCGSLLARLVAEGVELKCRRCKRTLVVPLPPAGRRRLRERRPGAWNAVQEAP
jgi:hypothetical protein